MTLIKLFLLKAFSCYSSKAENERAIIFSIVSSLLSFILYHYFKIPFLILITVIVISLLLVIFSFNKVTLAFIAFLQFVSMASSIKYLQLSITYIELSVIFIFVSYFISLATNSFKIKRISFTIFHFTTLIFLLSVIISAYIGLQKGHWGSSFRSDMFRGPIYFLSLFLFTLYVFNCDISVDRIIKIVLIASVLSLIFYFGISNFFALTNEVQSAGGAAEWGPSFQLFSMSIGLTFMLGYFKNKFFWIITALLLIILIWTKGRTIAFSGIFIITLNIFFYSFTMPFRNQIKFLLKWLLTGIISIILFYYLLLLMISGTQSQFLFEMASRMTSLFKPQYFLYIPSIQGRFLEVMEALWLFKSSNLIFGTGLGTSFTLTFNGLFFIDELYVLILSKLGIFGLLSFFTMMGSYFYYCLNVFRKRFSKLSIWQKALVINTLSFIPTLLLMATTMSHLWFSTPTIMTLCLVMALITKIDSQTELAVD
jgi:hypothetical protein